MLLTQFFLLLLDDNFNWVERIMVIVSLQLVIEYIHCTFKDLFRTCIVCNIHPTSILIDKVCAIILMDDELEFYSSEHC